MFEFKLNTNEQAAALDFIAEREKLAEEPPTAIGGRFTFSFTPTSIGNIVEISDCIGPEPREKNITDYDCW